MFKKKNIPALIFAGLLIALLVIIGVLSFVQNTFLNNDSIKGYDNVLLYRAASATTETQLPATSVGKQGQQQERFVQAMGKTNYSTMQAILEGRWNTKPKFVTWTNADGDEERYEAKAAEVQNYTAPSEQYLIELRYNTRDEQGKKIPPREITVENQTIKFDTFKFAIGDSRGEVAEVKVYAYEEEFFIPGVPDADDRYINPFYFYLNTNQLYQTITSIFNNDIF